MHQLLLHGNMQQYNMQVEALQLYFLLSKEALEMVEKTH